MVSLENVTTNFTGKHQSLSKADFDVILTDKKKSEWLMVSLENVTTNFTRKHQSQGKASKLSMLKYPLKCTFWIFILVTF